MGRNFSNSSGTSNSQYGQTSSTPVSAVPLTIACWFQPQTLNRNQLMVQIANSATPQNNDFVLTFSSANAVHANQVANAVAAGGADSSTTVSATGAWHHACAVFASGSSRAAYLDGTGKGTNTNAAGSFSATPNVIYLCYYDNAVDTPPFNGPLAEVGIWNVALSDAEVAALASGILPCFIRPASLVWYAPLWGLSGSGTEPDFSGGQVNLSLSGSPAQANHAPVMTFTRKTHQQLEYSPFLIPRPLVCRPRFEPAYFE